MPCQAIAGSSGPHFPQTLARWGSRNRCRPPKPADRLRNPSGIRGFSPHGRLPHVPSLMWAAAWDERCGGAEETFTLSTPGPADEGHARLVLTWKYLPRLAALEVSGATPTPTPRSSGPAMLGMQAASGRSSGLALHEARTLLGAGAGSSRIRFLGKPIRNRCASPPTSRPCRCTHKAGISSGQVQKRAFFWRRSAERI